MTNVLWRKDYHKMRCVWSDKPFLFFLRDELVCSWWKRQGRIQPAVLLVMTLTVGANAEDRVTAMKRWYRKGGHDSTSYWRQLCDHRPPLSWVVLAQSFMLLTINKYRWRDFFRVKTQCQKFELKPFFLRKEIEYKKWSFFQKFDWRFLAISDISLV